MWNNVGTAFFDVREPCARAAAFPDNVEYIPQIPRVPRKVQI